MNKLLSERKRQPLRYACHKNAHVLNVNSAFYTIANLEFGVFLSDIRFSSHYKISQGTFIFRTFLIIIGFLISNHKGYCQDLDFEKQQVKILSSHAFHGRGYVNHGDGLAAAYLSHKFRENHLSAFGKDYFQYYDFEVNSFPGTMDLKIDNRSLTPGIDFLVNPASGSCHGSFSIVNVDSAFLSAHPDENSLIALNYSNMFIVLDTVGFAIHPQKKRWTEMIRSNYFNASGIIFLSDKNLIFSVSTFQMSLCIIQIKRSSFPMHAKVLLVDIQSKLLLHHARNIIGFLPGRLDTCIVLTAHYDHLGQMGKNTWFPGASDNATGTAMLLNYIREYVTNPEKQKYTLVFMLFSGEEAGLLGSTYYVDHPLFPLGKIKILINLDMEGAGSGGITVFNGTNNPIQFHRLNYLNQALALHLKLVAKGGNKNSDQAPFHEKQVPALYILTEGKEVPYHSVKDVYETLPFTAYEKLYKLIDAYIKAF